MKSLKYANRIIAIVSAISLLVGSLATVHATDNSDMANQMTSESVQTLGEESSESETEATSVDNNEASEDNSENNQQDSNDTVPVENLIATDDQNESADAGVAGARVEDPSVSADSQGDGNEASVSIDVNTDSNVDANADASTDAQAEDSTSDNKEVTSDNAEVTTDAETATDAETVVDTEEEVVVEKTEVVDETVKKEITEEQIDDSIVIPEGYRMLSEEELEEECLIIETDSAEDGVSVVIKAPFASLGLEVKDIEVKVKKGSTVAPVVEDKKESGNKESDSKGSDNKSVENKVSDDKSEAVGSRRDIVSGNMQKAEASDAEEGNAEEAKTEESNSEEVKTEESGNNEEVKAEEVKAEEARTEESKSEEAQDLEVSANNEESVSVSKEPEYDIQIVKAIADDEITATIELLEQEAIEQEVFNTEDVLFRDFVAYDINLYKNGEVIEPEGDVTVTFSENPLEGDPSEMAVYHVDEEELVLNLVEEAVVTDGEVEMVTDHFSTYVVGANANKKTTITDSEVKYDKKATLADWQERTYLVTLTADAMSTKEETFEVWKETPVDVILVLDNSRSMYFPSKLTPISGSWNGTTGWYGQYTQGLSDNRNQVYYYVSTTDKIDNGIKGTVFRVYYDWNQGKWMQCDASDREKSTAIEFTGNERHDSSVAVQQYYTNPNGDTNYNEDRLHYLRKAASSFVETLGKNSPDSNVAVVTFGGPDTKGDESTTSRIVKGWTTAKDSSSVNAAVNNMDVSNNGGTFHEYGLYTAQNLLNNYLIKTDDRQKYVLFMTDGCYNGGGSRQDVINAANSIKSSGATIYSVGSNLSYSSSLGIAKQLMQDCASRDKDGNVLYWDCESADGLEEAFKNALSYMITEYSTSYSYKTGIVKDYIDDRFEVVTCEDCNHVPGTITGSGANTCVSWNVSGQEKLEAWSATILLRAKDEYMGGNDVLTNGPGSGITPGGEDPVDKEYPFVNPKVNVRAQFDAGKAEDEIFLGEDLVNYFTNDNKDSQGVGRVEKLCTIMGTDNRDLSVALKWSETTGDKTVENPNTNMGINDLVTYIQSQAPTEDTQYDVLVTAAAKVPDNSSAAQAAAKSMVNDDGKIYTALCVTDEHGNITQYPATLTKEGQYSVKVKTGTVKITKQIDSKTIDELDGDPIFTFKCTNTTTGNVFYRTVRFAEYSGKVNGTLYRSAYINDLPQGIYEIEELSTIRFKLASVSNDSSYTNTANTKSGDKMVYAMGFNDLKANKTGPNDGHLKKDKAGMVAVNNKDNEKNFSDTDVVVNTYSVTDGKVSSGQVVQLRLEENAENDRVVLKSSDFYVQ